MVGSNWRGSRSDVGIHVFLQDILRVVGEKIADRETTSVAIGQAEYLLDLIRKTHTSARLRRGLVLLGAA